MWDCDHSFSYWWIPGCHAERARFMDKLWHRRPGAEPPHSNLLTLPLSASTLSMAARQIHYNPDLIVFLQLCLMPPTASLHNKIQLPQPESHSLPWKYKWRPTLQEPVWQARSPTLINVHDLWLYNVPFKNFPQGNGCNWQWRGGGWHLPVRAFIHRFIRNNEPGIVPMTNNKEMVNETLMYLIHPLNWTSYDH